MIIFQKVFFDTFIGYLVPSRAGGLEFNNIVAVSINRDDANAAPPALGWVSFLWTGLYALY